MKKIIILFTLLFILIPNFVDAKMRISWWGSSITRAWIKTYINNDIRSSSSYSTSDLEMCEWNYSNNNYLCDSDDNDIIIDKEAKINTLKSEIDTTNVNQYSELSVNNYNEKVNNYNSFIKEHNILLKEKCISVEEYCKPYNCNITSPWTIYKKSDDKCICENWTDYNEELWKSTGDWCNIISDDTSETSNNETFLLFIIWWIIMILWYFFLFRKK